MNENFWGDTLEGQELPGGSRSSCDSHLIWGHDFAVWPLETTVCFEGSFWALEMFLFYTAQCGTD